MKRGAANTVQLALLGIVSSLNKDVPKLLKLLQDLEDIEIPMDPKQTPLEDVLALNDILERMRTLESVSLLTLPARLAYAIAELTRRVPMDQATRSTLTHHTDTPSDFAWRLKILERIEKLVHAEPEWQGSMRWAYPRTWLYEALNGESTKKGKKGGAVIALSEASRLTDPQLLDFYEIVCRYYAKQYG